MMNGGFLAPLFLAGFGLLVIPWLVHQIRRPEHKPVRFSSLMFVPQTRKRVVRRRRIEHFLLMLLRMALLVLLALAFTRPYWLAPATGAAARGEIVRHVILLDTSCSMGVRGWFEEARNQALKLLDRLGPGDRVAVVAFDAAPHVLAPLDAPAEPDAGSLARARQAVRSAELGWQKTDYLSALQATQTLLLGGEGENKAKTQTPAANPQPRLMIHLFTDFQHAGMPEGRPPWKLSSRIELQAIEIGSPAAAAPNYGVTDLAVDETQSKQLRIRAKVKNWSAGAGQPVEAKVVSGGQMLQARTLTVKPGGATQVIFTPPNPARGVVEGQVELGEDALAADNRYYFAWNPRPRHDVLLVADPAPGARRPVSRFIQLALPESPDLPWVLRETAQTTLPAQLADPARRPEIVLAGDLDGLQPESARALLDFVRGGGNALLLLGSRVTSATLNQNLLAPLGLSCGGPRTGFPNEGMFVTLFWVDLDHRIFMPFRDPKTSDFSGIHFFNTQRLALAPRPGTPQVRVLARLEDDAPLIAEARLGQGTLLVWAFGLDLGWTNLPKKATFIPLLHETLSYLTRMPEKNTNHRVGEAIASPPSAIHAAGPWLVQPPGAPALRDFDPAAARPQLVLAQPGFLRWKTAQDTGWRQVDTVNIDPRESDPQRIPVPEFKIRLCSAPAVRQGQEPRAETDAAVNDMLVKREWGHPVLALLLAFLLLETVYATRLAAKVERKDEEVES